MNIEFGDGQNAFKLVKSMVLNNIRKEEKFFFLNIILPKD